MPANCDGRYPHYLRPLADREPPDRIICVDVESSTVVSAQSVNYRTEKFLNWSAVCLRRAEGRLEAVYRASGEATSGFWHDLAGELGRSGSVWIVSWQCSRAWALLGLWRELESGRVRISGGDHRAVSDPDAFPRGARPGMLIAEDPPNLCQIRIGRQPGLALWLDCRNWGIDLDDGIARGRDVAEKLAKVVTRIDLLSTETAGVPIAPTVAGQAWRGWRATIGERGVHCHSHPQALALERGCHIGGRCEVFHMGVFPHTAFHLDFRSHYGSVMCDELFPTRLVSYESSPDESDACAAAYAERAAAKVTIETDEAAYPYLKDGDTIYPVGRFACWLCGRELADAVRRERVTAWHELAVYDTEPALLKFAAMAYAERKRSDEGGDKEISTWAKSLINALPGKLGYRLRCWETVPGALAPEPWGEWHQLNRGGVIERWRALAGVCQREVTGGYGPDAVPAIAAWITSHGRYRLLRAIRTAGRENVAYVDTDALVVNARGLCQLNWAGMIDNGVLGKLEKRASNVQFEALGIKHYIEGDDVKCAGHARGVATQSEDGRGQWYTPAAARGSQTGHVEGAESQFTGWPKPSPYRHGVVSVSGRADPLTIREV